jgi:Secretion system C-terminal sorting domain/PA domain
MLGMQGFFESFLKSFGMKQFLLKCFLFGMSLLAGSKMDAQAPAPTRTDTILLAVFNMSSKFRLKHVGFGLRTPVSGELLTQMVLAHDTVMTSQLMGVDSLGRQRRKWVTTYQCGKMSKNVKDKVALVSLRACDPTLVCLNAQRAGAKAVIFIHTANHRDSLQVPTGAFVDSIRIPCYVIRRDIGKVLSALLPSAVGIKRPDTMPEDAQARRTMNDLSNVPQATLNTLAVNDEGDSNANPNANLPNNKALRKSIITQIKISPNPATEIVYVDYQLEQITDAKVVAKNALGHLIYTAPIGEQSGTLTVPVQDWANGIYFFEVIQAKRTLKTLKIAIQH